MELTIDASSQLERIIILIDLDFFYGMCPLLEQSTDHLPGQVEQVRNPRLQGLPFVIKQKGIVATASYPARALGVKKLQSYSDAKRLVPDLITIVGEVVALVALINNCRTSHHIASRAETSVSS